MVLFNLGTLRRPQFFTNNHSKDPFDIQKFFTAFSESEKARLKYALGISIEFFFILCLFHCKWIVVYWEIKGFSENSFHSK